MKRSVWPQDLVEPQYIEGYFEESQNAYSDSLVSGPTIPSLCILARKVLGWSPRIAAAPSFPSMRLGVRIAMVKDPDGNIVVFVE